jgi:hypothetical protein
MVNRRNEVAGVTLGTVTPSEVSPTSCVRSRYAAGRWRRFHWAAATRSLRFARSAQGAVPTRDGGSAMISDFDLEQLGPQLAGDEEPVALDVVGDAVQDGAFAVEFALVDDALQIDSSQDLPGVRGNAHNVVCLPDIGINFICYPFEFIEVFDWPARLVRDSQAANGMERLGIEKSQVGGAVAHDQLSWVVGQAPTFAFVGHGLLRREAEAVVNKGFVGGPGQLNQRAAPVRQALAEDVRREIVFLQNVSSRKIDHAERRPAVQAGAFVKVAIHVDEALRKGMDIVRVGVDNLVGVSAGAEI